MWVLFLQPPLPYVYQSLFKHKVKIVDENGEAWTVQYEGFVSAAQRHYRFTAGWTNLVKQKGIKVGKALTSPQTLTCCTLTHIPSLMYPTLTYPKVSCHLTLRIM